MCFILVSLTVAVSCRESPPSSSAPPSAPPVASAASTANPRLVAIRVTDDGFEPSPVHLQRGQASSLEFTRTTDKECLNAVRMPWMKEATDLPKGKKVVIPVPTEKAGAFAYACWMNMIFGRVVIDP